MKKKLRRKTENKSVRYTTWFNVVPVYSDIIIPVSTFVFMMESQGMEEFMHDGTMAETTINQ